MKYLQLESVFENMRAKRYKRFVEGILGWLGMTFIYACFCITLNGI